MVSIAKRLGMDIALNKWFQISVDSETVPGRFLESSISPIGGDAIEDINSFLEALASRLMLRYESKPIPQFLTIQNVSPVPPDRTKQFYRRLIRPDGTHTPYFETWATETLGEWIEETFEPLVCIGSGSPHGSDPAYDIITLIDGVSSPVLRLVQVKSTENYLGANCNLALAKFEKLRNGAYLAELLSDLTMLKDKMLLPSTVKPRELIYDPNTRYRVTAFHGQNRASRQIMRTYESRIPGDLNLRSARLLRIQNWSTFWSNLSRIVHAQLI